MNPDDALINFTFFHEWLDFNREIMQTIKQMHSEAFQARAINFSIITMTMQKQQDIWIEAQRRWLDVIFPK